MPNITIVVKDLPTGGIAIESDDQPAVGQRVSRAQIIAREIVDKTRREYGLVAPTCALETIVKREQFAKGQS